MKKMTRRSKKGFTLTEIVLVVAIIVIVAAASFVGVAVTISNAEATTEKLENENGDNFESEAWAKVKSITKGAAEFFDIDYYTPDTEGSDDKDDEGDEDEGGWNSGSSTGGGSGSNEPEATTPAPKPPTNTPVPKPTSTPTPTPKPSGTGDVVSTSLPYGSNAGNGVKGIKNITTSGNTSTITMTDLNGYNENTQIKITRNSNGTYGLEFVTNQWVFQTGFPGFVWGQWTINELSSSQKSWLSSNYGLSFN